MVGCPKIRSSSGNEFLGKIRVVDGSESRDFCGGLELLDGSARSKGTAATEDSSVHPTKEEAEARQVVPNKILVYERTTICHERRVGCTTDILNRDGSIEDEVESQQAIVRKEQDSASSVPTRIGYLIARDCQDVIRRRRKVSFSTVQIREYQLVLSDNPGASTGVPIGIGWDHNGDGIVLAVDRFEERPRRSRHQFHMDQMDRAIMLKRAGYSNNEIKTARKEVDRARCSRRRTLETLHFERVLEPLEKAQRALLNITTRKSAKRRERDFLKPYRSLVAQHAESKLLLALRNEGAVLKKGPIHHCN